MTSPVDVCNQALLLAGFSQRIGSLREGTPAAEMALEHYAETRDEVFWQTEPDFARTEQALVILHTGADSYPPATPFDPATMPPRPWLYEYSYPTDAVKILSIKPSNIMRIDWTPRAITYDLYSRGNAVTILTNEPNAIASYVQMVLDPSDWFSETVLAVVVALAKKFEPRIKELMELVDGPPPETVDANTTDGHRQQGA